VQRKGNEQLADAAAAAAAATTTYKWSYNEENLGPYSLL